jgi:hypothetical protein
MTQKLSIMRPINLLNRKTANGRTASYTAHWSAMVMACDDEVIPPQERIETVTDDSDLEEVYNTVQHLLYIACTGETDHLLVTSIDPASEFLDDLET